MAKTTINGDLKATTVEINGSGDAIDKFTKESLTISTFTVGGHETNVQTITVTGVASGDFIVPAKPTDVDDEIVVIGHAATDDVVIKFNNTSNNTKTSTAVSIDVLIISFS